MRIEETSIPGVVVIYPRVFPDERGYLFESFQSRRFADAGVDCRFVQDNHSHSCRGALRGLHYQIEHPQGKLLQAVRGEVFDVAVDLRRDSPAFGSWFGLRLSEGDPKLLYIPPGLAHGFCVLSDQADVIYKCTDFYYPEHGRTIVWNDPTLAIDWPVREPLLSEKDRQGLPFVAAPMFEKRIEGQRLQATQ